MPSKKLTANPELRPVFVLVSLERSADFGDSFFAIFIQLLQSLLLCAKALSGRYRLCLISSDWLKGPKYFCQHSFEIMTYHFTTRMICPALGLSLTGLSLATGFAARP